MASFHTRMQWRARYCEQEAVRHCLMLMKELEGMLLVSLEFNGFPALREAYSLTPGPFWGVGS